MRKIVIPVMLIFSLLLPSGGLIGEEIESNAFSLKFSFGAETEILKRSLWWSEEEKTTAFNAYCALFRLETEILEGLKLAILAGYSSSDFHSLIFKHLPFSIDFEVGGLGGSLFGAELSQIFGLNSVALGGRARFLLYSGQEKKWAIPDLAVEGELKSQPQWKQITFGPILGYNGYENFFPYISIGYNYFWGEFSLREIIENLTGIETKEIKVRGKVALAAGASFQVSSRFSLGGEATFLPHKDGQNWSLNFKGIFSF
jgi:opacity protein-like surface antigen